MRFRPPSSAKRAARTLAADAVLSGQVTPTAGAIIPVGLSLALRGRLRPTSDDPLYPSVQIAADLTQGLLSGRLPWRPAASPGWEAGTVSIGGALALVWALAGGCARPDRASDRPGVARSRAGGGGVGRPDRASGGGGLGRERLAQTHGAVVARFGGNATGRQLRLVAAQRRTATDNGAVYRSGGLFRHCRSRAARTTDGSAKSVLHGRFGAGAGKGWHDRQDRGRRVACPVQRAA